MRHRQFSRSNLLKAAVGLLLLCPWQAIGSPDNGGNAPAFAALCGIYTLKDAAEPADWKETFISEDDIINSVFNANLSTATESWLKTKDGALDGNEGTSERATALKEWVKDVEARQKQKPDPQGTDTYAPVPDTPFKVLANVEINNIHKRAADLKQQLKSAKEQVKNAYAEAMAHIKGAIYGAGETEYKAATMGTTKQNTCGDANSGHADAGKNVINDMICLCTPHSGGATKPCGQKDFGAVASSPAVGATAAATGLTAACRKDVPPPELSAGLIEARLATFYAQIGANSNSQGTDGVQYTLGVATANGCTGSSQQECVNYKAQLSGSGSGIPWVKQLKQAAATVTKTDRAYAKAVSIQEQLQTLANSAESLRQAAKTGIQLPKLTTAVKPEQSQQTTKEEDCNKKGENECKPPCKVVDEEGGKKKCKLDSKAKEAVEKAAAIEEGKDGKTTNTTASNTFVIHKAPLWLAVLLL
uniref:Variant surface glycoprotein n=1 Tax=Trypanosoma brucei TaxID=5691 RepID=A0A1V0G080_9TRYP|nr:variant surface glycoprotein [Trypanosoma brucei]